MRIFDTHSHPQDEPLQSGLHQAVLRCNAHGLEKFLVCSCSHEDWAQVEKISAEFHQPMAFGVHPWYAEKQPQNYIEILEEYHTKHSAVVGEIGLDFKKPGLAKELQINVFRRQLRLAKKLGRPVSVHALGALDKMLAIIKDEKPPAVIMHAWSGPPEMIKDFASAGCHFSFSAKIADVNYKRARTSAAVCPVNLFHVESDAPDLSPDGTMFGAVIAVEEAAKLRNTGLEEFSETVFANSMKFFEGLENI